MEPSKIISLFVAACWIAMLLVWVLSAFSAKKSVSGSSFLAQNTVIRLVVIMIVFGVVISGVQNEFFRGFLSGSFGLPVAILGAVLVAVGIAVAIWARLYLGRNWGMPMSMREEPELVSGGPYHFIRHPIYAGILLAALGTALALSPVWFVIFVGYLIYFFFSAGKEEQNMLKKFPQQYAAYMKTTKRLIPFIY